MWLAAHQPGQRRPDTADLPVKLWRAEFSPPLFNADALLGSDSALLDFAIAVKQCGIALVNKADTIPEVGFALGKRMGFLRPTNFGLSFRMESKPNPNALAYTAEALPLHTDLPNHELPPGFQFLHCFRNEAQGGGSVFADGYAIAEQIRGQNKSAFNILSSVPVSFRFYDTSDDIRVRQMHCSPQKCSFLVSRDGLSHWIERALL